MCWNQSFGTTIIHVDADAFFASCAQALNPQYKGKPVVTGAERGIIAAASYEAKALGVARGISLREAKELCPELIVLPTDYESYSLFSERMFNIVRRYTPVVEEYSIDEAFADIKGMRRPLNKSYYEIGKDMKETIESELGITVSLGLAPTKVLAKIASKWDKPSGLVMIKSSDVPDYLGKLPIEDIWGIGRQTSGFLKKYGIRTALDFARKDLKWVENNLSKPYIETWLEINRQQVFQVKSQKGRIPKSISKTKTFSPASSDRDFVFSKLTKNLENAFIKLRRYNLSAQKIYVRIKEHDRNGFFKGYGLEAKFNRPTSFTHENIDIVRQLFDHIYKPNKLYRATSIYLADLKDSSVKQPSLFEEPLKLEKLEKIYEAIDELAEKYGKHTIFLGAGLSGRKQNNPYDHNVYRTNKRQFLGLPTLD